MKEDCVIWPETDRPLGVVQQKPQNDKRARRCYRCDPLGHLREHAPGADLARIVGPSYSSTGPSGVLRTTRRGPIVSNLAPSGLFLVGALCLSVRMYFQRQPSTTNLSLSRQNDQRQNFEWTACLDEPNEHSVYILKRGSAVRTSRDIRRL